MVHIIDELLTIPLSISATLIAGNFTALAGAATQAGLVPTLEGLSDVTIFAPNNDAFQAIGGPVGLASTLTLEQLADVLQYHVVQGIRSFELSSNRYTTLTLYCARYGRLQHLFEQYQHRNIERQFRVHPH